MTLPDGVSRTICSGLAFYSVEAFKSFSTSTCRIAFGRYHKDWDGKRDPRDEQISIQGLPYSLTAKQTEQLLCRLQMMNDLSKVVPRLLVSDWARITKLSDDARNTLKEKKQCHQKN